MRLVSCLVLALSLCTLVLGQNSTESAPSTLPKLERFSPDQGDKAADPCNDFFQYACGKWIKANPIPPDQPGWGTFNSLAIWNLAALRETLEDASKPSASRTPMQQKAGDYYAACMNEQAINQAGVAPLQPLLDRIAALQDKSELPAVIAYIHQRIRPANLNFIDAQYQGVVFGTYAIADFNNANQLLGALDQSGMNMPSREFYLKDDDKSKQIREQYLQHVTRMLQLVGETQAQAAADAQTTLKMETTVANSAMDIVVRRDPKNLNNKMTLEQVQALTPSFDWKSYFAAMHAPASPAYIVISPQHFKGLEKLISSEPIENWRAYLRYSALHYLASSLSQRFVDENFAFYGRILNGSETIQARSRRCSSYADSDIGEVVGQAYVQKYFPPENKQRMLTMVKAIEAALHQDIDSRTWMSDKTKKLAHAKLQAQVDKIGYPDKWRDYSSLEIRRDDFLGNVERSAAFEINWRISKFGKPADRHEWNMTPPTVNAYEDPQTNTINFPAGILQPPFFDASKMDAVNFGAIGAVIGHEITHGYDDQGRKFDAVGNLRDWWTPEDAAAYEERGKCIADEYTEDIPEAGVRQNGQLTLGEDTADNGGIHLTLAGLDSTLKSQHKTLDSPAEGGLTQLQTFFLSYANVWCGEQRPELARTAVLTQGHSLNRYRVNNVLANMNEFAHAFGCHSGQPMVHANQCRVW